MRKIVNEPLAFWLAPLVAAVVLIPVFSFPASPWFLGNLAGEPMSLPGVGPCLSAMGVLFDGTILGYVMTYILAVPIYFLLKEHTQMALVRVMILFCLTGVAASQVVHGLQNFRQPALREFASGWMSPVFGCLCGAAAGLFFAACRKYSFPKRVHLRLFFYALPAFTLILCGFLLVQIGPAQKHRPTNMSGLVNR